MAQWHMPEHLSPSSAWQRESGILALASGSEQTLGASQPASVT